MYANQKTILDKRRPKKSGLFPVKVRVTFEKTQKYFSIGVDLSEDDFNRIRNHSVRKELKIAKGKIQQYELKITNALNSLNEFTFHDFQLALDKKGKNKKSKNDVYQLFDDTVIKLNCEGRIATATAYNNAAKSLKRFKAKLTFNQVNVDLLREYESKLKSEGKSISTIGIYLRHFRAICNKAIEDGIIDRKQYPFGKNKYQIKAPRNIKKALTISQIKSIIDYKVKEGSTQHFVRDIWLFSYLCNGMNVKDIINLKFKNIKEESIQYDRAKTANTVQNPKPIVIALLPQALEIIGRWGVNSTNENDYVFPVIKKGLSELQRQKDKDQFIQTINKYMKLIGEDIGYDKPLTTYAARHSFATVLKRSGTPMEFISESLGHKSLQTTEAYLDSFEDSSRRKFMQHLIPK